MVGKAKRAHRLFAKRTFNIAHIASPVLGKQPSLYITVEAAVRPIGDTRDVAMLHRIEMDVIDMAFVICLISNGMLPVTPLPNTLFPLADLTWRPGLGVKAS